MAYVWLMIIVITCKFLDSINGQYPFPRGTQLLATRPSMLTGQKIYSPEPSPHLKVPEERTCIRISDEENIFVPLDDCVGWLCWNSQLTLIMKYKIHALYNDFRRKVAKGPKSISNMNALVWHLTLELEARRVLERCNYGLFKKPEYRPFMTAMIPNLWVEAAITSFKISSLTQAEALEILPAKLEANELKDYDNEGNFRRTETIFYGCALSITESGWSYFACVYASKVLSDPKYGTPDTQCPSYTTRFDGLCKAEKMYPSLFLCDLETNICPIARSDDWLYTLPGTLYEIMQLVCKQIGYFEILNTTKIVNENGMASASCKSETNVWENILPVDLYEYAPLIPFYLQYSNEQYKRLNMKILGQNITIIQREHNYIVLPNRRTCPADCCWWMFISSIILASILISTFVIIIIRKKQKK